VRTPIFAALVALLAFTGCSSDDEAAPTLPDVTSTLSPSGTPTGTPSPTPSPSSTAELEAEVTAFFEDYIDTVNESWTSEKALERRREMFEDTCSDCLAGYLFAKRAHDDSLTLTGNDGRIVGLEFLDVKGKRVQFMSTEYLPARDLVNKDGDVVQEFAEYENIQVVYDLVRSGTSGWVIVSSEVL
jgi:hypothetical protein